MANILKKKVNIYPMRPVKYGKSEIRRSEKGITMSIGDIYNALLAGAKVEEVLSNGKTVNLTRSNYNKANEPKVVQPKGNTTTNTQNKTKEKTSNSDPKASASPTATEPADTTKTAEPAAKADTKTTTTTKK